MNAGQRPDRVCILHLITRLIRGGAQFNTLYTAAHTAIPDRDVRTVVAAGPSHDPGGDLLAEAAELGVELAAVPHFVRRISLWHDALALLETYRLIKRLRPTIVHTHTSKAGFVGRVAARFARVPCVIHTPHGAIHQGYFKSPWRVRMYVRLERFVTRWCDAVVCLTNGEKRDWHDVDVVHSRTEIIPSGVDLATFAQPTRPGAAIRDEMGLEDDARIIGYVGRLVELKGIDYLVQAMPAIIASEPKAVLLILGDGEQRQALHNLATELGVQDCVVFAGARDDVPNLLAIMEVAVLPTICTEAMGRVLVEAAAAGKPVVATRLGGVEDIVVDNETGLIVAPEDAAALSAAIGRVLADPAFAATMGAAARIRAERFSLDAMMQKLNALYTSFL